MASKRTARVTKSAKQLEAERIEKRAQDLAAVNMPMGGAVLEKQAEVRVVRNGRDHDGKKAGMDTARRLDAFLALKDGLDAKGFEGSYDAARKLEHDLVIVRSEGDRGHSLERVDCAEGGLNFVDRQRLARGRIADVQPWVSKRDWWLLTELMTPVRLYENWRQTVAYITGEENAHAQGAVVRSACVNLRDAYRLAERLDRAKKAAAAKKVAA